MNNTSLINISSLNFTKIFSNPDPVLCVETVKSGEQGIILIFFLVYSLLLYIFLARAYVLQLDIGKYKKYSHKIRRVFFSLNTVFFTLSAILLYYHFFFKV